MSDTILNALLIALMVVGFGFVVFWHELGHFLAAKWVGIKVEQFALGFGTAIFSWRKGIGLVRGSSRVKYEEKIIAHLNARNGGGGDAPAPEDKGAKDDKEEEAPRYTDIQMSAAGQELGLGETEYRLNWLPLGGYVKMLGQDDMNPAAASKDPRSYTQKTIRARMLVVSAGVIMNVILAGLLFMVVFLIGFHAPAPVVSAVLPMSPAQYAGIRVGDRILSIDGSATQDFTKIRLDSALVDPGKAVPIEVQRPDKSIETLWVTPEKMADNSNNGMLDLGLSNGPLSLKGFPAEQLAKFKELFPDADPAATIMPGDEVVEVGGDPVKSDEYWKLDQALQKSGGKPVHITVKNDKGVLRQVGIQPHLAPFFGRRGFDFFGMQLRTKVVGVTEDSSAKGKLQSGDVITFVQVEGEALQRDIGADRFSKLMSEAGAAGKKVTVGYLRKDVEGSFSGLEPNVKLDKQSGRRGLGVQLESDEEHAVVGSIVDKSVASNAVAVSLEPYSPPATQPSPSPAATRPATAATHLPLSAISIRDGATVVSINGTPVANWFDVQAALKKAVAANETAPVRVVMRQPIADVMCTVEYKMTPTPDAVKQLLSARYVSGAQALIELNEVRQTSNPLRAAWWGVTETRDMLLQFYVMLRRLFQGSVPASGMMGPLGIFTAGASFATKGTDWLLWFLAMISANLAVLNFLPIPIVDGGLFVFLIVEKISGRPPSAKTQTIAQLVGLAIILSIFVFATYHDITRLL